jgi:hypothetical protein
MPAIKATLCLVLVGYIVSLLVFSPLWVIPPMMLPIWLGALWWLIYSGIYRP